VTELAGAVEIATLRLMSLSTLTLRSSLFSLLILLTACGSSGPTGAPGVAIKDIAIYQSLERMLVRGGKTADPNDVPLISNRAAMVRVFYRTDSSYDQAEVTARLTIKGHDPIVVTGTLGSESAQDKLDSTINFYLTPEQVTDPLEYSVELLQDRDSGDNPQARFPSEGLAKVAVEGKKNTLRILLVPFRYKADGSDRVPDTSPEQLERFKKRFMDLYPVSDAEIKVHPAIDWTQPIERTGQGWQEVGLRLLQVRTQAKVSDDTYLYGIFNPAASLPAFCGPGCLLGVTLLNNTPVETGIVQLRLALGIGFKGRATATAAHEIGHAHGRGHANCGPGLDPRSIDAEYPTDGPHAGGKIGVWGFDMAEKKLVPPTSTDIMGYCDNQWISDYNFVKLWNRVKNVNTASWQLPANATFDYDVIALDGAGGARWAQSIERRRPLLGGGGVDVVIDEAGETSRAGRPTGKPSTVRGEYFRFDHIPGGWLFVPRTRSAAATYRFHLGGRAFRVQR
jgi:hypothetical protein